MIHLHMILGICISLKSKHSFGGTLFELLNNFIVSACNYRVNNNLVWSCGIARICYLADRIPAFALL